MVLRVFFFCSSHPMLENERVGLKTDATARQQGAAKSLASLVESSHSTSKQILCAIQSTSKYIFLAAVSHVTGGDGVQKQTSDKKQEQEQCLSDDTPLFFQHLLIYDWPELHNTRPLPHRQAPL